MGKPSLENAVNSAVGLCLYYASDEKENLEFLKSELGYYAGSGTRPMWPITVRRNRKFVLYWPMCGQCGLELRGRQRKGYMKAWVPRVEAEMIPTEATG